MVSVDLLIHLFILTVIFAGLVLRVLAADRGHNYDFESFLIVAKLTDLGENVYANTDRYNYGPVWFHILLGLYRLAKGDENVFRYLLVPFLGLVDTGIFLILLRKLGIWVACIFFLNPISIIITGYHNQFDNLAILISIVAVLLLGNDFDQPLSRRGWLGVFTLGLSLATKHIFFLFPFWLAVKQKWRLQKAIVLLIPIFVFIMGFFPYWNEGKEGIIQNVVQYISWPNEFFFRLFIPAIVQRLVSSRVLWILLLILFAFVFRKKNGFESLLFYTGILVAASPAITNQYLAIPVPFVAANFNLFTLFYTIVGTWYLVGDRYALHYVVFRRLPSLERNVYYEILVLLLTLGFTYALWRKPVESYWKRIVQNIHLHPQQR